MSKIKVSDALAGLHDRELNIAICEWRGWKHPDHPDAMALKQGWTMADKWRLDPQGQLQLGDAMALKQGWTMADKWWLDPQGQLQLGEHSLPDHINSPASLGLIQSACALLKLPTEKENYIWWLNHLHPTCTICHSDNTDRELRMEVFDLFTTSPPRAHVVSILQTIKPEMFE